MFIRGDSKEVLSHLPDNFVDLIVTDPPYGLGFMGKDWDKALPDPKVWQECFRVLKEGKLAFIMCSPRQDVLARMIISLEDAGFKIGYTSIYYTYASGFPKASNIQKSLQKKHEASKSQLRDLWKTVIHSATSIQQDNNRWPLQELLEDLEQGKQCEIYAQSGSDKIQISKRQEECIMERWRMLQAQKRQLSFECQICKMPVGLFINGKKRWLCYGTQIDNGSVNWEIIDENGMRSSYKPQSIRQSFRELDVICEQCITQKIRKHTGTYVGFQPKPAVEIILVVSKGKTLTWLDDCRIPYQSEDDKGDVDRFKNVNVFNRGKYAQDEYSKNMLVNSQVGENQKGRFPANLLVSDDVLNDGKSWRGAIDWHKATSIYGSEGKQKGKGWGYEEKGSYSRYFDLDKWYSMLPFIITPKASKSERGQDNKHPTVKPIKLMSYLITLGSRENDLVLDPFVGSGTTYKACLQTHRRCIGIEINKEYIEIAKARISPLLQQQKISSLF